MSAQKLQALREQIKQRKLSGFLQPVHDEYLNEYPPECHQRVAWLTGFTGSAGSVAVLADKAALFVDGRYTLQAKQQVDGALFEQHNIIDLLPEAWFAKHVKAGEGVGYDPRLHGRDAVRRMEAVLKKNNIALVPVENLVDLVWKDRPSAPNAPIFIHDTKFSGESSAGKRGRIAKKIQEAGADAAVINAPDSVDWLLNIRGADVEASPLALAPAIVSADGKVQLFIEPARCDDKVRAHLGSDVTVAEPKTLEKALLSLSKKRVLADPKSLPVWYWQVLEKAGAAIVEGDDPCLLPKAMKNPVELQGMRDAHIRDGAAVVKLLAWLDRETAKRQVTEMDVSDKLLALRTQGPGFHSISFAAITGSGPNGAVVHYRVTKESNRALQNGELFLLDSGGQYPDGTTDITRTVPIGVPTGEHKDRFTRVLKGHIAIATARFPEGTAGSQLDALARQYLWQAGLDYDHGTGHGVGHFLNVHEGPQRISKRGGDAALKPGMIVSNEPGYYKSGEYGIRIENLVVVTEQPSVSGHMFLGFDTLTCVPIDTRLVDSALLTRDDKEWLNAYHAWVEKQLAPLLDGEERSWLKARCAAL